MLVPVLLLALLLVIGGAMPVNNSHFHGEEMCDVEESVNRGCSIPMLIARSPIECSILCWRDTECVGASTDSQGRCLHHQLCHTSVPCPEPEAGSNGNTHRYMARYCVHGTWNITTKSWMCRYGTFGERCNEYYKSCRGLSQSGYTTGSIWVILNPLNDGVNLIKIVCSQLHTSNPRHQILFNNGELNPNRTWNDYVNGFADGNGRWAGLRAIYVLGQAGIQHLWIVIRFTGGNLNAMYRNFELKNHENGYSISSGISYSRSKYLSPPSGVHAGDCLSTLQGVPFSTWDRDQDGSVGENCASLAGSGWWYKGGNCDNPCNMLGSGMDNYQATPPAQRLSFLGANFVRDHSKFNNIDLYIIV